MIYMYDEILDKMMYTILDEKVDLKAAVDVANVFKQLNVMTKEYVLARMSILLDMEKTND